AFIFERTGRVAKTHRGVHGQFLRLLSGEQHVDAELRRFLSEGYRLKSTADYEVGPDAIVPLEEAAAAIETTARFVATVAELMAE
ncbi:MAG TPA: HEPN domain-containing protein, partial [Stellaceae bacterium]|nr:HEPN domain-containing protein [Stellaceae bacterium]